MTTRTTALVVGAGPVGLAMAAELTRYGVAVRLIDKAAAPSDKSKALVIWSRTLELIDRMGCGADFLAAGMRLRGATISAEGRLLANLDVSGLDTPHPYALAIPQSETERLFTEHLSRLGVRVERETALVDFSQSETGVRARLARPGGGQEEVECDWLIGCDGAHSTVRHVLQVPFTGVTEPADFLLADVRIEGAGFRSGELGLFWHKDGVLGIFPFAAGRARVIADLGPAPNDRPRPDPSLAEVQRLVDERGPKGLRLSDPVWLANFRVNERKVADYRKGRVFLAGDAAHIHSPAGGQGMNTGIQDACNLAWKLALVCRGIGGHGPLLDSYSAERSAVGEMVLKNAARLTHVAILKNPLGQIIRNNIVALLGELPPVQRRIAATLAELDIAYPDSPLNRAVPGAAAGRGLPKPGERAPLDRDFAKRIGAGGEPKFVLLGGASASAAYEPLMQRFGNLLTPIDTVAADLARKYGGIEHGAFLIRPDGYIALAVPENGAGAVENYLADITR
ncbi:MAG TPA: FAD-dependent monooxygenase [Stellaceae bacterium]|nr:FAD-dependent monooxygenase [Stellaceae bacterium]